ncbi:hypothetical protein [Allosphingosinicella vermicomposti]|uniref:hypothetical protein n=1 Tax=Allosphingosinicella vermicomposti TaxID=614671 RepID=UPI000D10C7C7|nr:hypothetical protein [Allosphingosinicella vermicomposti]
MKKIFAATLILALASSAVYAQKLSTGFTSADAVTLSGGTPQENTAFQSKMRAAMRHILSVPAIAEMTGYKFKLYARYFSSWGGPNSLTKGLREVEGMVGVTRIGGAGDLPNIKLYFNSPILLPSAEWAGEPNVFVVRPEVLDRDGIGHVTEGKRLRVLITKPGRPAVLPLTKAEAGAMELAGLRRELAAKPGNSYISEKIAAVEMFLAGLSAAQKTQRACRTSSSNPLKRYECSSEPPIVLARLNPAYLAGASKTSVRSITVSLDHTSRTDILSAAMEEVDMEALQTLID